MVIVRCPDKVKVDNGPVFASEKGSILRIFCRPLLTASTGAEIALLMPSVKVVRIFFPDSLNHAKAPLIAFLMFWIPWENLSRIAESFPPVRLCTKLKRSSMLPIARLHLGEL